MASHELIQEELEEASEESFHWPEIKKSDGRKMKTVFWDKLSHHQVMSSMWVYIYKQFPDIKINKILDLYEDKIHRKKPSASAEKKKPQSTKQTFIYDDQRKQSISIGVTKLLYINRLSWEQIVEMILKVDEKVLGLDAFVNMKVLAPLANEMELCRAYKGRVEELDVASRWVLELQKIPAFAARFDCLEFVNGFEEQYTRLKKIVDEYKGLCDYLVDSSEIQKLLRVLLDAGNIVNSGTRRGDAYGFRLESLKDFLNCKSPLKKGLSLLEYVLTEIHAQTPSILEFSLPTFRHVYDGTGFFYFIPLALSPLHNYYYYYFNSNNTTSCSSILPQKKPWIRSKLLYFKYLSTDTHRRAEDIVAAMAASRLLLHRQTFC